MTSGRLVAVLAVAAIWAGCSAAPVGVDDGSLLEDDSLPTVFGTVVDAEFMPLSDAIVIAEPSGHRTITGPNGAFELSLPERGRYTLIGIKEGYADGTVDITVEATSATSSVMIQLVPVSTRVPYYETQAFTSIVGCALATPTSRITCGLVEQLTGVEIVPDSSVFSFTILADGLLDLLIETGWEPTQSFARELSVNILDQEGDQTNCLSTKCYAEAVGPSPIRFHLFPDARWKEEGPWEPFNADVGHGYNAYLMPPFGTTADNAVSVYLDQQVDSYLTFFYNRVGSEAFTALPDN